MHFFFKLSIVGLTHYPSTQKFPILSYLATESRIKMPNPLVKSTNMRDIDIFNQIECAAGYVKLLGLTHFFQTFKRNGPTHYPSTRNFRGVSYLPCFTTASRLKMTPHANITIGDIY